MLSKVTIETDFKGITYFKIHQSTNSTDLRDRAFNAFKDTLSHESEWCKIIEGDAGQKQSGEQYAVWYIHPISPQELREQANKMLRQADLLEQKK